MCAHKSITLRPIPYGLLSPITVTSNQCIHTLVARNYNSSFVRLRPLSIAVHFISNGLRAITIVDDLIIFQMCICSRIARYPSHSFRKIYVYCLSWHLRLFDGSHNWPTSIAGRRQRDNGQYNDVEMGV